MAPTVVVSGVVFAFLAVCLVFGLLPAGRGSRTAEGFVAGDRSLGLLLMYFITGATIFSAFAFLGAPGWAYSRGAASFYILGYGVLGFVPFYFVGPRAARLGRRYGFVTQAEMVGARFDSRALPGLMALVSLVGFVPYLALQMKGAGYVFETVTGGAIPEWVGGALVYGVVLTYVLRSGVLGVGWTNAFQGVFMMVLAWILGLWLPTRLYGGVGPMFERIAESRPELLVPPGLDAAGELWSWGEFSTAVLVSAIGFSFWPHLFMKAFTAKDEATIRRTAVLYPTFQLFIVPLMLIGFAGVLFESRPEAADQILPHMLMNLELPALLVGLFCAGALAASMSSGDAIAHAAASIFVRDGLVRSCGLAPDTERQRRWIRWSLVPLIVGSYVLAVTYQGSIVKLLLFGYGPIVQFAPIVVASLLPVRLGRVGAVTALAVGIGVTLVFSLRPELRPWPLHAGFYGLLANIGIVSIFSVFGGRPDAAAEEFLQVARGRGKTT